MDPFGSDSSSEEENVEKVVTSMTEEKKREEIKNVFGEDSSDSDEEEAPVKKRRRLGKMSDKEKKQKKSKDDGTSAYDKEVEVKETKEDLDFIDSDDDEDLLAQYKYDQNFKEDEVDTQFDKGASGGAKKKKKSGVKVGKKRVKIDELLTQDDKDNYAQEVLRKLEIAHEMDIEAHKNGKPMVHKFKSLKYAMTELRKKAYQSTYMAYSLLVVIEMWLQDLPGGNLCNKSIREAFYDLLPELPVEEKHLIRSSIGKRLIAMANHPDESMQNKVKIKKIVEKWMRPIFKKSSQYSQRMEREYAHRTVDKTAEDDEDDEAQRRRLKKRKKKKASRDAIQKRLASQKREPRPGEPGFTWYAKIPEKMSLSGLKRIRKGKLAAKKAAKSKRQHDISRKLIKMKQKANSKSADLRPIKVSVQGRGL